MPAGSSLRIAALLGLAALAGCGVEPSGAPPAEPAVVWPDAPAPPRIAYVGSFTRAEDLGIEKGMLARLGDWLMGPEDLRIERPMAVVARDGLIHVADSGAGGVHRFDLRRGRHDIVRLANGERMVSPVGLALGPDGDVYVTDPGRGQLLRIEAGAEVAVPVPHSEHLERPTGVAVDAAADRIYVVDTAAHRVKVFTLAGEPRGEFGGRGQGPGEFNFPTMIWRGPGGRLLVTDSLNFRVQVFEPDGQFVSEFGEHGDGTGNHARPKGIATDSFGHVYVVDAMFHVVQVFDDAGAFLLHVGSQGQGPGEFWLPVGIFIDDDETIYVADSYNHRVQMLRYVGAGT